ncbi:hypothetical protein QFC20_002097 [Naganishia adeliensis]|uniref:Uncharacterized protein n=1 Tax=Naganishia adeliensis TaxID=92952 RepID=A0ACC2WQD7_9TREE|nr:hypothetical protein QFC20_002097 [Naganishia adeliensis]
MRSFQREFPALQQAQILAATRQRAEANLPYRIQDEELAVVRRVSPRHATGVQVDPLSVLLIMHERHPNWCQQYYEYLIGRRPGFGLHVTFNRHAAVIIDDLREGRVRAPAGPAQRVTFHVLRQPHACWNIGATNLIKLLERLMTNSGSIFPPERPAAMVTVAFQNILVNSCPEPIILAHHRSLLEQLQIQRLHFRNRLAVPARAIANIGANAPVNALAEPAAANRPRANLIPDFEVPIPDEAPPPYEAIEAPRRGAGRAGLRAGHLPA